MDRAKTKGAKRTKASRKPAAKAAKPARVTVKVDAKLEAAWLKHAELLKDAKNREASGFDVYWESASAVIEHDPPMYLAAGFADAKAFIEGHLKTDVRSATRWMRVARHASPVQITKHGPSKLDAALALLVARGVELSGRVPVDFDRIRVPVMRDGAKTHVLLEHASVDEVTAGRRLETRKSAVKPQAVHPIVSTLSKAFRGNRHLHELTVRRAGDRTFIGNIPDGVWAILKRVLYQADIPVE